MSAPRLPRVILASSSPRRRELLAMLDVEFEVCPSGIDEIQGPDESPYDFVARLAREKAEDVAARSKTTDVVLGADTIVVVDGLALGKPSDDADAARMLRLLSGRPHEVYTAIHLIRGGRIPGRGEVVATTVYFREMSAEEIAHYVASGEPRDRAGAYAIQGGAARFVDRIEGCFYNVMGLPVAAVYRRLKELPAD